MVACRYGISLLVFNFISHSFAVLTCEMHVELNTQRYSISIYTIAQVILTFWLVLSYDLLEDRYMIDVITTKFFFLHFKMVESFEKRYYFTWLAEEKVQKHLVEALNRYEKHKKARKSRFFFREWLGKNTRAVTVGSWARLNQTQNWSCYASNLTNPINKVFVTLIYLKNSTFLNLKIVIDTDWCQEWSTKSSLLKFS